jgi:tetratricopeptide (TPR) repeat protein
MGPKSGRLIPLGIILGALVVRVVFLLQTRDLILYYHPVLDSGFFNQWADFKRQIGWIDASVPFRESLYAYFLGVIYTVFRESTTIARLVQCVLGSLTALLVYSTARRLFGAVAGLAAGVIFVFYGPAVFFASELNDTTLAIFLLMLSAYLLVRAAESRPGANTLFSGLFLGAAAVTKFMVWVALPAWIFHLLLARTPRLRKAVIPLAIGVLIAPLCYQFLLTQSDQLGLVPPRLGWHAFLGSGSVGGTVREPFRRITLNTPEGSRTALAADGLIDGQRDALRFANLETDRTHTNVEAGRYWHRRAYDDFAASPGRWLRNYFTKLGTLMGPAEPPANIDQRFIAGYSGLLRTRVFTFAVVAPLGLVGLVALRRRGALYASLFVPLFAVLSSAYLVSDNDKMMMVPFLTVFAGGLIAAVVTGVRSSGKRLAYVVAAVVAGLLLYLLPKPPMDEVRQLVALGNVYGEEAIYDRAEASYREALELGPERAEGYVSLARMYANAGKPQQALEVLQGADAKGIRDPRIRIERASVLNMAERPAEAVVELKAVEREYPYEPRLHQLMGLSFLAQGDAERAAVELEKELSYVGAGFVTYSALGSAKLSLGEFEDAAANLEAALALNPYNSPVAMQLADAYSRLGHHYKACDVLSRILGVDPGNMPLRFKLANCLYRADRYGDALTHFRELHKYDPANADVVLNMGTVYAAMDSLDRAIQMWEKALVLDPDNDLARENLRTARE